MSITIGLAKVSGAVRCQNLGIHLEGGAQNSKIGKDDPLFISDLLSVSKKYLAEVRSKEKRRKKSK